MRLPRKLKKKLKKGLSSINYGYIMHPYTWYINNYTGKHHRNRVATAIVFLNNPTRIELLNWYTENYPEEKDLHNYILNNRLHNLN